MKTRFIKINVGTQITTTTTNIGNNNTTTITNNSHSNTTVSEYNETFNIFMVKEAKEKKSVKTVKKKIIDDASDVNKNEKQLEKSILLESNIVKIK